MGDPLLIATIGHVVSALLLVGTGTLVLSQNPTHPVNRMFFFASLPTTIYGITLAIGINLDPP